MSSSNSYAITVRNVSKNFRLYRDRAWTLKERVLFDRFRYSIYQVLENISLRLSWGKTLGVIGVNGSGKSTLLKLLTGIVYPDEGSIDIYGKVSSLLELGAGFHPDFSGRDNIYNNASIFGLSRREIQDKYAEILDFSELHEWVDSPVRTYSSGMQMRLAFSVAISVEADILLIDEILAVGDASFQSKCLTRLQDLRSSGKTIVIVTHDMSTVESFCDEAVWLDQGAIRKRGVPNEVVSEYLAAGGQVEGAINQ